MKNKSATNWLTWLPVLALILPGLAMAQGNLVENPGFDSDFSSWSNPQSRRAEWSEDDASNSPASGSANLYNEAPSSGGTPTVLMQCFDVDASREYQYGGQGLVPPGQPTDTRAEFIVITYPASGCVGEGLQVEATWTSGSGDWEPLAETIVTDSSAQSLSINLGVFKPSGIESPARALFDNVFVQAADDTGFRVIDERYSGSWFNPENSGQGIFLDISPYANLFFGGWFTWTDTPGEIDWMTVQGGFSGDLATLTIYR